jgi:hypothetical protein
MIREPSTAGTKNVHHARQLRRDIQRPHPPNLPRQIDDGIGAAVEFGVGCNDAHFPEQLLGRHSEKGGDAWILQSRQSKAALLKCLAKSPGERSANSAIAVEKDPATGSVAALTVSHF